MCSWNMSSAGPTGAPPQGDNFGQSQPRMHSHSYSSGPSENTPTLNHLLQSSPDPRHTKQSGGDPSGNVGSFNRDEYPAMNPGVKGESYDSSPSMYMSPMHHQPQMAGWGSHPRGGGHQYVYPPQGPGPGSTMYPNQPGGGTSSDMSQARRPPMGGSPYPQPGSQYMGGQQMAMGPGPQRFMVPGQMPNQMYNQSQMYMSQSQQQPQQHPAPSVSPAGRPLTPQLQQMQNMISNSPKQPSPAPSISSDHGSTQSSKPGDDGIDIKLELSTSQEDSGDGSSHRALNSLSSHRPVPSPVGSTSSRSNTPASIPGTQSGSPMPIRPPSGQVDGQANRMTQSPMATQGYNPGMMPPPNNMGYMPNTGKMPGHYPPYNTSQYPPQGNYTRQQSGMAGPGGMSGPMGSGYHSSQQGMYPNGPSQMQGGNSGMYGMGWNVPHSGYGPNPYQSNTGNMMGGQYPGYGSHVGPMPGQPPHNMQQQQPGAPMPPGSTAASMPPGSAAGPMQQSMGGQPPQQQGGGMMPQHSSAPMNKAAQAAQAVMMAATNSSVNPRMPHVRNSMSPSRGMFGQGGGSGPLAQMNNMTNSPNLGSPSLNSMSNAVEQISRNVASSTPSSLSGSMANQGGSIPSPGPKTVGAMGGSHALSSIPSESNGPLMPGGHLPSPSPLSNPDPHESLSRPNSTTAIHPSDLPTHDTTSSESSSGMPSDSTSVDSGFHSSDQFDKTSDSVNTPNNQMGTSSPPPHSAPFGLHQNGEAGRTVENISPPSSSSNPTSRPTSQDPKMPYMNEGGGIPLPPTSLSNSMTPMPATDHCVTTTATFGHPTPSVTQSIASPVTSSTSSHHPSHMGGPPGPHGMMNPGMTHHGPPHHGGMHNGMMNSGGHMRGPHGQMHPGMGGGGPPPPHSMMGGPGMAMNQNGPMMGGPPSMMGGPNGGMMPHGSMGNNMPPHMGQMPQHHQQMPPHMQQHQQQQPPPQQQPSPLVNNHPDVVEQQPPPEKKKKVKDMESPIMPRSGYPGAHYSEEPNSPGVPKSASDISKLFEMGHEPDRRPFIEGVLSFLEESGNPITSMPSISKTPLDLYKLYFCVREKGGFEEVTRSKKWREVCTVVNIGTSASAAFTLKKNYIRYLFNYECKYDRGGLNPGPILAQMEAQMAHKREQKNKRVPSPGSNNSNDAFRPPSTPANQMDGPPFPPGMPPPYMQNPDGSNMMMGPGGMIGSMGPNMMAPNPGMMGGPNMMGPGQQGAPPGMGSSVQGPPMMSGGPPSHPGYGAPPMMQQHPQQQQQLHPQQMPGGQHQQPPQTSNSGPMSAPPSHSTASPLPVTSDSISVQDPFSDEPNSFNRSGAMPPVVPGTPVSSATSVAPTVSSQSSSGQPSSTSTVMSTGRPPTADTQMTTARPNDAPPLPVSGPAGAQFPFGPQFDQPDRFDQSSPSSQPMRHPQQPAAASSMAPSPQPPSSDANTMYPQPPRFHGPTPPQSMPPTQYPPYQGQTPSYPPGPPYQAYPNVPPSPYTPGPRPPATTPGIYGTPTRRYPDAHEGGRDGQWSPLQRPRMQPGAPGYMSPGPPTTPPMGTYGRSGGARVSPQARGEGGRYVSQKMAKASYPNLMPASSKKELLFPPDCVEGVSISTFKRKRLNSKDLAPFEAWRLMLALKSGLLAESTWALDTLNILLYDDSTHSYFSLSSLPGLLEVLSEHLRHCLMQIFSDFDDLEDGFKKPERRRNGKQLHKLSSSLTLSSKSHTKKAGEDDCVITSVVEGEVTDSKKDNNDKDIGALFRLEGTNYTLLSRKGLPVKFDTSPSDRTVLESKSWDLYTQFEKSKDHWSSGCGDLTEHIQTQFESEATYALLSRRFYRKRSRLEAGIDDEENECDYVSDSDELVAVEQSKEVTVDGGDEGKTKSTEEEQCGACGVSDSINGVDTKVTGLIISAKEDVTTPAVSSVEIKREMCEETSPLSSSCNHSKQCNGSAHPSGLPNGVEIKKEVIEDVESYNNQNKVIETDGNEEIKNCETDELNVTENKLKVVKEEGKATVKNSVPVENGELEEPTLSPMTNSAEMNGDNIDVDKEMESVSKDGKKEEDEEDCPPPVLKAERMDEDLNDTQLLADSQADDSDVPSLPMNSTLNDENDDDAGNVMMETSLVEEEVEKDTLEVKEENKEDEKIEDSGKEDVVETVPDSALKEMDVSLCLNESFVSETEEMSASFVSELLKEEESIEDEAFQRDDPPMCVTEESRDELGRRCVCISNILRSLSCVPGNEIQICRHAGMMKILGRLLLLHHSHPKRPPPRKVPRVEEEEKEEPPRVYDDEHWWWDYLDQLRENTLVILANICSHLMLGNFSEQLCFPLLEGLLHWVICPASVARDPLPTLSSGSTLSPQRLVLEALCKLCIHETNVDLLLATPPMKRLLELFGVLVNLLADREHQITREFSIVLLSLLVQGDSSVARALALQHPCVSVLVDFLEMAEKNALSIANQQGLPALQSNPEAMGTSLDMLRRAASILLHMARVPDNRRLFIQQQNRLLNLVMSQILDQSVANTLSEVLFECSQVS